MVRKVGASARQGVDYLVRVVGRSGGVVAACVGYGVVVAHLDRDGLLPLWLLVL